MSITHEKSDFRGFYGSSRYGGLSAFSAAVAALGLAISSASSFAAEGTESEAPFTLDRTATLKWLEGSKAHKARLPLPKPSNEDRERAKGGPLGGGIVNNGLMRRYYLPSAWSSMNSSGLAGRQGKVDSTFKVELFWIASRLNQCAYCLGHQEVKLSSAGLSEDAIAALDGDWSEADEPTRAARKLAVWVTVAPQRPIPKDILDALAKKYDEGQIDEIILAVANYNAMNRWTGPLNIPQEDHRTYADRANEKTAGRKTQLVELAREVAGPKRDLPAYDEFLTAVKSAAESKSNKVDTFLNAQGAFGEGRVKSWQQALAETTSEDAVPVELRSRIFWVCARADNAADAGAKARAAAISHGDTDELLRKIAEGADDADIPASHRKALALAKKITVRPGAVTDEDISEVNAAWGDRATAQIVEAACIAAAIDRCDR
jgi:alkylhydroperoxidase family enzyme